MQEPSTGLEKIYVTETEICKIDSDLNDIFYRQHSLKKLVEQETFFRTTHMLWNKELPDEKQEIAFLSDEKGFRDLSKQTKRVLLSLPKSLSPIDQIRTAVSALWPECIERAGEDIHKQALFYLTQFRSVVAACWRIKNNQPLVPSSDLANDTADFLYQSFAEEPAAENIELLDKVRIIYAEHELNAASFVARIVGSTEADIGSTITASIAALSGPIHGGAVEHVFDHFENVKDKADAASYIHSLLENKKKVMGFGHRVYMKTGDPRFLLLHDILKDMPSQQKQNSYSDIYMALADTMKQTKGIAPNLDLAGAACFKLSGFTPDFFLPLIITSRLAGWAAHFFEQKTLNKIIRPRARFISKQ